MRTLFRSTFVQGVFVCVIAFALTTTLVPHVYASGMGWLWYSTNATFQSYLAPVYRAKIQAAAADYDSTDLNVGHTSSSSGSTGYISFYEGNYAAPWTGKAEPYNATNQICINSSGTSNGNCNTTNKKATYGYVKIDMSDRSSLDQGANAKYVIEHEAGHIFGMGHEACVDASVMVEGNCPTRYSTLQTMDRTFLNNNY